MNFSCPIIIGWDSNYFFLKWSKFSDWLVSSTSLAVELHKTVEAVIDCREYRGWRSNSPDSRKRSLRLCVRVCVRVQFNSHVITEQQIKLVCQQLVDLWPRTELQLTDCQANWLTWLTDEQHLVADRERERECFGGLAPPTFSDWQLKADNGSEFRVRSKQPITNGRLWVQP